MFNASVDWRDTVSTLFYPCNDMVQLVRIGEYNSQKQPTEVNELEIQYLLVSSLIVD